MRCSSRLKRHKDSHKRSARRLGQWPAPAATTRCSKLMGFAKLWRLKPPRWHWPPTALPGALPSRPHLRFRPRICQVQGSGLGCARKPAVIAQLLRQTAPAPMEGTISHLRWHRQRLSSTLTILTNHFLSGGKWSRTRRRCGTNPLEFLECLAAPFEFGRGGNVLLQQAHHLCRDGFSMGASALPKGLVKIVRNVFDIQRCHWITPRFPLDYPRYIVA